MNTETEQIFLLTASTSQPSTTSQKIIIEPTETTQVNLENVEDFSHVCRICATITEFVLPIFDGEGLQNNLADKIHTHLPIKVTPSDVLPRVVCYQCASTLLAWHELVQCSLQAERALRARLARAGAGSQSDGTTQDSKPTNSDDAADSKSRSLNATVQGIIVNYFHNLNLDNNTIDVEFVCQKCSERPALATIESLAEHLKYDHSSDISDEPSISTFIKSFVTFEEALELEMSDANTQDDSDDEPAETVLPKLRCPFCTNTFSSHTRLICHLNKHMKVSIDAGVDCCDILYRDKKSFVDHLQIAHVDRTTRETGHECRTCAFIAEDAAQLREHVDSEHGQRPTKAERRKELSSNNQKNIPAVCPVCNCVYSNKYNMFIHMKSHQDGSRAAHKCDKCGKTYSTAGNLRQHRRAAHDGDLRFLCPDCGERFATRSARDIHARLHSGEKPYRCEHCGNRYRAKNTLDRHVEIHLGIRRHECAICSRKFSRKAHLVYHVRTHRQ